MAEGKEREGKRCVCVCGGGGHGRDGERLLMEKGKSE